MSKSLSKSRFVEMFGECKDIRKIGDVISISRGASPRPISAFLTNDPDGVNWIKIGDVPEDSLYITSTAEKITKEGAAKSRLVKKGDFILSNSMSFGRPYILGIDGCVHDGWLILSDFSKCFNEIFLYHALRSDDIQRQFSGKVNGATVKNLNSELVKETTIIVPPIKEQIKYSEFVKQLDKLKFILQKMIEKLELLKKSRFVEMFGNIKETIPLENCCSLISDFVASGSFASLRDNVKYYDKENYAVLVSTIDFANYFSKDLVYTDKHGYDFLSKTNLYGGEILLSNIGASIGKVFRVPYLNKPMTLAPNSIVIKPNDNYTNEFLEYFFSIGRGQDELHVMTTATATPKFNKTQLRQVPVPKVSKEIQNDFSCFVKQLDKSKLILQKQLDDLVGETK